jgi:hypothetical protein
MGVEGVSLRPWRASSLRDDQAPHRASRSAGPPSMPPSSPVDCRQAGMDSMGGIAQPPWAPAHMSPQPLRRAVGPASNSPWRGRLQRKPQAPGACPIGQIRRHKSVTVLPLFAPFASGRGLLLVRMPRLAIGSATGELPGRWRAVGLSRPAAPSLRHQSHMFRFEAPCPIGPSNDCAGSYGTGDFLGAPLSQCGRHAGCSGIWRPWGAQVRRISWVHG